SPFLGRANCRSFRSANRRAASHREILQKVTKETKVAGSHRTTFFVVFVSFCYKKHFLFASFCYDFGAREATRLRQPAFFPQLRDYDVSKGYGVVGGQPYFGASEFTIFSKHGSPRNGSHHGISFNS